MRFTMDTDTGVHEEFNTAEEAFVAALNFREVAKEHVDEKLYGYAVIDPLAVTVPTVEINDTRYTKPGEWSAAVKRAQNLAMEAARKGKK